MPPPSLADLLAVATEAAYLGGRRTLAYFNTNIAVETKSDDTPVTLADREAEQVIRARIAKTFPTHSILGEETGATAGDPDYRWIIDPIDGTKSFIHGVPLYGVLIGVEVHGQPRVGVIYMPALDEMLSAADGLGCAWNGRPARVSSTARLEDACLTTTSPETARARSDAYQNLASGVKLNRAWGDAYGYALVATGRCDVMLDPKLNAWDCAPLIPILREAGGRFSDWTGKEHIWGNDGVATNGALHDAVLQILRCETRRA
ncbi:MAG TPA: histidinol-phosphatase [Tepidisphaeraceae bacterium]|nr:histidinol-phosphatase [Tepidisphaeraceae bacterium]